MNIMLQKWFCENVKRLMKEKGLSQSALGREMGVSPQYVHNYINGRANPGLDVVERFANGLDVTATELISDPSLRPERVAS